MAVTKLAGHGREHGTANAVITIATSTTISAETDLEGYAVSGLIIPTIDSANVTFSVSNASGGTFYTLKDEDGNTITITATTGNFAVAADFLSCLDAYRYVKVITSQAQGSNRTFIFCVKG